MKYLVSLFSIVVRKKHVYTSNNYSIMTIISEEHLILSQHANV